MNAGSTPTGQTGLLGRGEMIALKPRPSSDNVDTFTYILQRSSQEQQAYMLWEHAYVQALQDQPDEAQRLGQASVSVFEEARHPSAAVVRAWLHQQGLLSPTSPGSPDTSRIQRKRASRPWLRVGGASVFVMLVLVAGLLLSGIIPNHPGSSTSGDIKYSPLEFGSNNPSTPSSVHHHTTPTPVISQQPNAIQIVNQGHVLQSPTSTPLPTSTPIPTSIPAPTPIPSPQQTAISTAPPTTTTADPSLMPTITPGNLNTQNCPVDGSGYRCTITLAVYANTNATFSWQASSTGIPAKFNSLTGTTTAGNSFQMITYLYPSCPQSGTLSFKFFAPSSTRADTVSTSWNC